jgi:hypothetical protein
MAGQQRRLTIPAGEARAPDPLDLDLREHIQRLAISRAISASRIE